MDFWKGYDPPKIPSAKLKKWFFVMFCSVVSQTEKYYYFSVRDGCKKLSMRAARLCRENLKRLGVYRTRKLIREASTSRHHEGQIRPESPQTSRPYCIWIFIIIYLLLDLIIYTLKFQSYRVSRSEKQKDTCFWNIQNLVHI